MKTLRKIPILLVWLFLFSGCVPGDDYESISPCETPEVSAVKATAFFNTLQNEVTRIKEPMHLKLYVTSSDKEDNIYGAIYLQDHPSSPSLGVELRTGLRDAYLLYPPGTEVLLSLEGLYVKPYKGGLQVGSKLESFGNTTLGRIPAQVTKEYLRLSCGSVKEITARPVAADTLDGNYSFMYVRFNDVQLVTDDLCKRFAEPQHTTIRTLNTCDEKKLELLNSGYSAFSDSLLPSGTGHVQGILKYRGSVPQLLLNSVKEVQLTDSRCDGLELDCSLSQADLGTEEDAPIPSEEGRVLISELADPLNTTTSGNGRFIELFNASDLPADLSGWELRRYTNGNAEFTTSTVVTFAQVVMKGRSTLVIAANPIHFEEIYGFAPDLSGGGASAADSNGDDNVVLVNAQGQTIDVFGVPGEDGTGTYRDFMDGRAVRRGHVTLGKPVFDLSEWEVHQGYNADGNNFLPRYAPTDLTPGVHDGT